MEIEFKNLETQEAFNVVLDEMRREEIKQRIEQQRLKRGLYLLRSGQWSPNW